jgi:hypothetical protein
LGTIGHGERTLSPVPRGPGAATTIIRVNNPPYLLAGGARAPPGLKSLLDPIPLTLHTFSQGREPPWYAVTAQALLAGTSPPAPSHVCL